MNNIIKKSPKIFITFWGTRGSIPTPGSKTEKYGGNTPCISLHCKNTKIILDAGTGIRDLGLEIIRQTEKKKRLSIHLLLSHTHWDHIQGLPFFAPAYLKSTNLYIYGSPKRERFLGSILKGQMDVNYFPVGMNSLAANLAIREFYGDSIQIGPFTVDLQEQYYHPGGSVRYSLSVGDKKIVYATDMELNRLFQDRHKSKDNKNISSEYTEFIHGTDLLIADGQYTKEEYPSKKGWGHSSIPLIIKTACLEKVKQLAIFHHDPQHSDMMLNNLFYTYSIKNKQKNSETNIFWAREGMTLEI